MIFAILIQTALSIVKGLNLGNRILTYMNRIEYMIFLFIFHFSIGNIKKINKIFEVN